MTPQWLFFGSPAAAPSDDWDTNETGMVWPWRKLTGSDSYYNPNNSSYVAGLTVLKALSGGYTAGTRIGPGRYSASGSDSGDHPPKYNYNVQSIAIDTDAESLEDFTWPPYIALYYPYEDKGYAEPLSGNGKGWYIFKIEEELGSVVPDRVTYEFDDSQGQNSTPEFPNGGFGNGGGNKTPFMVHLSEYDGNVKSWTAFDYYTVAKGQEFTITATFDSDADTVEYTNTSHGTDSGTTYVIDVLDTPRNGGVVGSGKKPRIYYGSEAGNQTGGSVTGDGGWFDNSTNSQAYMRNFPIYMTRWEEEFTSDAVRNGNRGNGLTGYNNCSEAFNVGSSPYPETGYQIKVEIWGPTV